MSGAVTAEMIACLKALSADDKSANADRASRMIRQLGGEGTPKDAQDWLESLGESGVAPSREQVAAAISVKRGERSGDLVLAHRTLERAGLDADRYGNAEDEKQVADLRERMHTTRPVGVHWERSSRVFPQITKEEATRRIAARGDADRGPPELPTRDMLEGPRRDFVASRGRAEADGERERVFGPGIPLRGRS